MKNFSEKLIELMNLKNVNTLQLASILGISQPQISLWRSDKQKPSRERIKDLSDFFGVPTDYLLNDKYDNLDQFMNDTTGYMLAKKQPDTIYVPFFKDGLVSAGKGILNFDNGDHDYLPFKESDLRLMFNVNPKSKLGIIPCAGNSMEPTIKEGDLIVFQQDFSQVEGAIYICRYDGELFVKRLRKRPKIALISDNKDYEPIEINEAENIEILGRVVGCYSLVIKRI
ncbi:XRE family transcriptional regulator [Campylobacter sp. CN_NE3]|uniref:XRE family transcriptional regulator n=1 Tax=Campylobacter sp. CN_NE3 TaxID=2984149 RepID=UPI0022E9DC81|nr:XRE family transcriptional regulator [Campylobacter sp. CN_NE3]MDA3069384.1 XRE family transcriptional regulator [Campylobacter sp. CN_NE3]